MIKTADFNEGHSSERGINAVFALLFYLLPILSLGCSSESVKTSPSPYTIMVQIREDSLRALVAPASICAIDDSKVIVSQSLHGKLLLIEMNTGNILKEVDAPPALCDSAFIKSRSTSFEGPFTSISVDSASKLPVFDMQNKQLPRLAWPRYIKALRRDKSRLDVLTSLKLPGIIKSSGNSIWITTIGVTTLSLPDFAIESFTPLESLKDLDPQFTFFSIEPRGGWWVPTYNFSKLIRKDSMDMPLLGHYDFSGKQSGRYIHLPAESNKQNTYFHLLNDLASLDNENGVVIDTRDAGLIVYNTTELTSFGSNPLLNSTYIQRNTTQKIYVQGVCALNAKQFEAVVSFNADSSSSPPNMLVTFAIDSDTREARIVTVGVGVAGEMSGPGFARTVRKNGHDYVEIVRLVYKDDAWHFGTRVLP